MGPKVKKLEPGSRQEFCEGCPFGLPLPNLICGIRKSRLGDIAREDPLVRSIKIKGIWGQNKKKTLSLSVILQNGAKFTSIGG